MSYCFSFEKVCSSNICVPEKYNKMDMPRKVQFFMIIHHYY